MPRRVVSAFGSSQTRRDTKAGLPPTRKDTKAASCRFPLRAGWNGSWSYDQSKGTFGTYGTEWRGTRRWSVSCRFVSGESRVRVRRCDDARRVRHGRRDWRGEASSESAALMANIVARRYGASPAFVVARKRNGHAGCDRGDEMGVGADQLVARGLASAFFGDGGIPRGRSPSREAVARGVRRERDRTGHLRGSDVFVCRVNPAIRL